MGKGDIDPNLGLIQRALPDGGPLISMVKGRPGIYWDSTGEPASDDTAAKAGFDVKGDKQLRAKEAAKAKAYAKIETDFAKQAAELDKMSDDELEREGIVEPGSLPGPNAGGDDELAPPFITTNAANEPRTVRVVPGGPVKEMEYIQADTGWTVTNLDTEEVLATGLNKDDALELLLKE